MQAPGGAEEDTSGGFDQGGWVAPHFDAETGAFMNSVFERTEAFLLGRRTYEIFAAHWPEAADPDDPIANGLNTLPKHVASTTLTSVEWENSSLLEGDVVQAVTELKAPRGRRAAGARQRQPDPDPERARAGGRVQRAHVPGDRRRRQAAVRGGSKPVGLESVSHTKTPSGVTIDVWRPPEPRSGPRRARSTASGAQSQKSSTGSPSPPSGSGPPMMSSRPSGPASN